MLLRLGAHALALFELAEGDVERCVTYGANLGRDADTIASMCGAIAGALRGARGIKSEWLARVVSQRTTGADMDQEQMAEALARTALIKAEREQQAQARLAGIARS